MHIIFINQSSSEGEKSRGYFNLRDHMTVAGRKMHQQKSPKKKCTYEVKAIHEDITEWPSNRGVTGISCTNSTWSETARAHVFDCASFSKSQVLTVTVPEILSDLLSLLVALKRVRARGTPERQDDLDTSRLAGRYGGGEGVAVLALAGAARDVTVLAYNSRWDDTR